MGITPEEIVARFHDAINAGNAEAASALVTEDVELGGPRGTVRGVEHVPAWMERAGVRLVPVHTTHHGDALIVEADATWLNQPGADKDADADAAPKRVATVFRLRGWLIRTIVRCDSLADAQAVASRKSV